LVPVDRKHEVRVDGRGHGISKIRKKCMLV
jgi:hypothetical protein